MLNLNSLLVFSENAEALSDFYGKVLQKEPDMTEGGYYGFVAGKTFITFGPHDKVTGKSREPERIMFNFETKDVKEEFERIKELGAIVIKEPYQMAMEGEEDGGWIATFADPDGNYFQLMTPWEEEKK